MQQAINDCLLLSNEKYPASSRLQRDKQYTLFFESVFNIIYEHLKDLLQPNVMPSYLHIGLIKFGQLFNQVIIKLDAIEFIQFL